MTATSDLQSKFSRAIKALLVNSGVVQVGNCFVELSSENRPLPNTSIYVGDGNPFEGPGNFQFPQIILNLRDDSVVQPTETDRNIPRKLANQRLASINNCLNLTDDGGQTLFYTAQQITLAGRGLAVDPTAGSDPGAAQSAADNADMADFTCLWWEFGFIGPAKKLDQGTFLERDICFSGVACNTSF